MVQLDPSNTNLYKNILLLTSGRMIIKRRSVLTGNMHLLDKEKQTRTYSFRLADFITVLVRNLIHWQSLLKNAKQALASADSVFQAIAVAAPDSYLQFLRARANSALDPETTLGLAKPFYEEVATLLKVKMILKLQCCLGWVLQLLGYYYLLVIENWHWRPKRKRTRRRLGTTE